MIDCGANVDARASHLVQFAKMGSIYMEHVIGIKSPKVGIVNIGAEEEKGNALVKETIPSIKRRKRTEFYRQCGSKRDSAWAGRCHCDRSIFGQCNP